MKSEQCSIVRLLTHEIGRSPVGENDHAWDTRNVRTKLKPDRVQIHAPMRQKLNHYVHRIRELYYIYILCDSRLRHLQETRRHITFT